MNEEENIDDENRTNNQNNTSASKKVNQSTGNYEEAEKEEAENLPNE